MKSIAYVDTEVDPGNGKVRDIGCIKSDGSRFHSASVPEFVPFVKGASFICGHNIIEHDLKYIGKEMAKAGIDGTRVMDTLYLSPLLFPQKPYHALLKDDKLQTEALNNPFNDALKAKELFEDEVEAFVKADPEIKGLFYMLLHDQKEFAAFFRFMEYSASVINPGKAIRKKFKDHICQHAHLSRIISSHPVALAYCLALIHAGHRHSITPPWVIRNYPQVEQIMFQLRNKPCLWGCVYCDNALDIHKGLKRFFGFDSFKTFDGKPLQENAMRAAVDGKSILTVFPTGGGKSITFQVPALMSGENAKGLTVIISPLQSLMKDQVDNLEKLGITDAVTINGLLDPVERAKSFERVEDGSASILYISPESLRSPSIERRITGRKITRFVIDEAHCFSSWGQDFRVDYLYIGDFIKTVQEKKQLEEAVPVSCFTATAKQQVVQDICAYFKEKLNLELELFTAKTTRKNLRYKVFEKEGEQEKYQAVRNLVEEKQCPAIVYVSRTRKANELAARLIQDGINARPFHGKMDVKEKEGNQNAFIDGDVPVIVATSAFGMGVDKKDVGMVIHYDISDSLENYVQEAGRAGRDENITAECYVLYNEEDLSKHFVLLNQTRLSVNEIQQVWRAIKEITRFRSRASNSALEIARKAGWDDNVEEIETRVTTAIAALEDAGYLKRGQNMPRVFANSILAKNAQEAIDIISCSQVFNEKQKEQAIRIIKKLVSVKSRKQHEDETAESRVDYISDHLGIPKEQVIRIVNLLREINILADTKDLTAFVIKGKKGKNPSLSVVKEFGKIEKELLDTFSEEETLFHVKTLNQILEEKGCSNITSGKVKTIINFWAIKNWIYRKRTEYSKDNLVIKCLHDKEKLKRRIEKKHDVSTCITDFLHNKAGREKVADNQRVEQNPKKKQVLVEFSVLELRDHYNNSRLQYGTGASLEDVEDALFYLSRIEAIKIEGGFMVTYNRLTLDRLVQDNRKQYTVNDYQKLDRFYENKVQQIHIAGEYAKKMVSDYTGALQFVDDYFHLNFSSFLSKYFPGSRADELKKRISPAKFRQLFEGLSAEQMKIIKDNKSKMIVVAAGPGSGKTRVLVHKLASLLLMEDVKHEQLLMITFSRAAATEFKQRLHKLIGNAANYIEIKTFHSYCFDLSGKMGCLEQSGEIVKNTVEKIRNNDVERSRITKTVLVFDEAQDMDNDEFNLISALREKNHKMRVIAVGDDDQNIYEFRGSSSRYLKLFVERDKAVKYELLENYRSKSNLVEFANQFAQRIESRLKDLPIQPKQTENGRIKLVRYQGGTLITPLFNDIMQTDLSGTTAVLTQTNEEALQITGLLLKRNMPAKMVQTNEGFSLYNLLEVRFFVNCLGLEPGEKIISGKAWNEAKRKLKEKFYHSSKLEVCLNMIKAFEGTATKRKYKTDLEIFIRESKMEDFYSDQGETILVSTIHKAKGKEFDNVFILLDNYKLYTEEKKRLLYVAVTRAKQNLNIHVNSGMLDHIAAENMERRTDNENYSPPPELAVQLTLKDVWLDFFMSRQHLIDELVSGDTLMVADDECLKARKQKVVKFSRQFLDRIGKMKDNHYVLKAAKVNNMVYWKKEGDDKEVRVIMPELYFERQQGLF